MSEQTTLIPLERVESCIYVMRDHRVILDEDLARLYGVPTRRLNEQVRRNLTRFPADFMFELSPSEWNNLKSQSATSRWGGRRKVPKAFTEHGAIMAASVLNSERAVVVSIHVVRAFVKLRSVLASHAQLSRRLDALERKYDTQFKVVFDAIRELMTPPSKKPKKIGFASKG